MKTAKELHENAISLYEEFLAVRFKVSKKESHAILKKAFKLEEQAAFLLKERYDLEPTRSKLFASAATMAYQLLDYRESEQLVAWALAGNPPTDVLDELRDLFDKVNFRRHLTTKGVELSDHEFRFTLGSGNDMMKGIARGDEVIARIEGIEGLYRRTVQRMLKKPYHGKGRVSENESKIIQLYCQTPIAASFAIIFKIPQPVQNSMFPELDSPAQYVDEMIQCIDLVNEGKMEELRERIHDESYFQSFVINARKIAPDGENIKQVGFTVYRDNKEVIHPFNKIQSEIALDSAINEIKEKINEKKREKITVSGILLASDSPKKTIKVVETVDRYKKDGTLKKPKLITHKIKFTTEAQKELVRDHYEENVAVQVWKYEDKSLEFIDLKQN